MLHVIMTKKYCSSDELMEAMSVLDCKKKYEVMWSFNRMMGDEGFLGDDSMMYERFGESFSLIGPALDK